ncbi:2-hydroxyacyl-CoA dehydratase family protein [Halonatronum saccharophilum]|uniref:2-hydroxyacyl-CoA dehydratase family protein n=1 Tax=Halonatronum saccharophilum TaxID=150060 RepID=UPI0004869EDA|nr:2-hydroxyacyl-CoA dehydratase [Halonatronum saccharophilum]
MKRIGITTTVPIEILLAAGYKPVDLNNLFITSKDYSKYIDRAERDGFPKSSCAWIKGIYGACLEHKIEEVIGVIGGDCSNTKALIEVLKLLGIKFYPFAYPHNRSLEKVKESLDDFMDLFGVTLEEVEEERKSLKKARDLAKRIDELTFKENKATGFENHLYQVSCSDFDGDILGFEKELKDKIEDIKRRDPLNKEIRLGFIGVPPMTADIYEYVNKFNAYFVYNEVQREFAFPRANRVNNIYEQYYDYTYPYDIEFRLEVIKKEIEKRNLDAIIHYTQAFCYREIEDILIKDKLDIPILSVSGDKFNYLDSRTELRLEAFLDMLGDLKGVKG